VVTADWDYLVVTASNDRQAAAYEEQLSLRADLGFLPGARRVMAVADPAGRRVGSGGSTVWCLLAVLGRELGKGAPRSLDPKTWRETLERLRILIVHAGGDSRRLPTYGPCGKIFIPLPGESDQAPVPTIFDRMISTYLALPRPDGGKGQVVVTSGDVLLEFDPGAVRFAGSGITGVGSPAAPELAANHGVFCPGADGRVRLFLQKPSPAEQAVHGAVRSPGRSILDIGVMSLDSRAADELIRIFRVSRRASGRFAWEGPMAEAVEKAGLDFYREIACAMGSESGYPGYEKAVRKAGSALPAGALRAIHGRVSRIPFHVSILPRCGFLHFGTPRQLIQSGNELAGAEHGASRGIALLSINNEVSSQGRILGGDSWVEGCRVSSDLVLGGDNVVAGVDISKPLSLPRYAVLDVLDGLDRRGRKVRFVRCYGVDDVLNAPAGDAARFCGMPLSGWFEAMGAGREDIWGDSVPETERLIWNGRFFPAAAGPEGYRAWLWMTDPASASPRERIAWKKADRYSFAEMAGLASQSDFHSRRTANRAAGLLKALPGLFHPESGFSAVELAYVFSRLDRDGRTSWLEGIFREAFLSFGSARPLPGTEPLGLSRILHTLASAVSMEIEAGDRNLRRDLEAAFGRLPSKTGEWMGSLGIGVEKASRPSRWAEAAKDAAFVHIGRTIVFSRDRRPEPPASVLRSDEIIWGRAPARLDLGGGWTDTPPYSLENGGCVINAAVTLNGQPPIHAYARVIDRPEIRIGSIDHGVRVVIRNLEELLDYRQPESRFGLAKAALALSGFSPETAAWPRGARTLEGMLTLFGGGIELTTLAAIPSGSGLGTSSIMGTVLLAVIHRMIGRRLSPQELFHGVLRLEQELTTGGGWQDQIGGAVGGVKMITTGPGLVPDPRLHFVPPDVLDPATNEGTTLLYYTGLRRLAKNILRAVVGRYLDRDRAAMQTLRDLHAYPPQMVSAMAAKDRAAFGGLIDRAWNLNKSIDPDSTTPAIEAILEMIGPHIHGAKLLGAGGGGFLLIVAKSPADADAVRRKLATDPPNDRARFFDFAVSPEGLAVTVC
jgi:fucokinase